MHLSLTFPPGGGGGANAKQYGDLSGGLSVDVRILVGKLERFSQLPRGRRGGFVGIQYMTQNMKYCQIEYIAKTTERIASNTVFF